MIGPLLSVSYQFFIDLKSGVAPNFLIYRERVGNPGKRLKGKKSSGVREVF